MDSTNANVEEALVYLPEDTDNFLEVANECNNNNNDDTERVRLSASSSSQSLQCNLTSSTCLRAKKQKQMSGAKMMISTATKPMSDTTKTTTQTQNATQTNPNSSQNESQHQISATATSQTQTDPNETNECDQKSVQSHSQQQQTSATSAMNSVQASNCSQESQLAKETQEFKAKIWKLQLEVEEKNEIINVLKDELETLKEQCDKYQKENIQLVKDAKRVLFLQDENDFLQGKLNEIENFKLEIKHLKERLSELDYYKIRCKELEQDRDKAQEDSANFEAELKKAQSQSSKLKELDNEVDKWKNYSHEVETERNQTQTKLLESIEQVNKFNLHNRQLEVEVKRLTKLVSENEEQIDELESNKKLIQELRQDLNCERSLAQKLAKQLASFTKQIRSLDKQYFPLNDSTSNEQPQQQSSTGVKATQKPIDQSSVPINNNNSSNERLERQEEGVRKIEDEASEQTRKKIGSQVESFSSKGIRSTSSSRLSSASLKTATDSPQQTSPSSTSVVQVSCSTTSLVSTTTATTTTTSTTTTPPVVITTTGHDSGFQSINQDFNQISPVTSSQTTPTDRPSKCASPSASQVSPRCNSHQSTSAPATTQTQTNCGSTSTTSRLAPTSANQNNSAARLKIVSATETATNCQSNQSKVLADIDYAQKCSEVVQADESKSSPQSSANFLDQNNDCSEQPPTRIATDATGEASSSSSLAAATSACRKQQVEVDQRKSVVVAEDTATSIRVLSSPPKTHLHKDANCTSDEDNDNDDDDSGEDEEDDDDQYRELARQLVRRAPTPVKSTRATFTGTTQTSAAATTATNRQQQPPVASSSSSTAKINSNFVRNSAPSRSVNFGHSKLFAAESYLDRIRASVTATATTTNTISSFSNEQQTRTHNLLLVGAPTTTNQSQQQTQLIQPAQQVDPLMLAASSCASSASTFDASSFMLNCMLEHQHTNRCLTRRTGETISTSRNSLHPSSDQVNLNASLDSRQQQQCHSGAAYYKNIEQQHSRQLSALIDPMAQEHLIMRNLLLQQQQHQHQHLSQHPINAQLCNHNSAQQHRNEFHINQQVQPAAQQLLHGNAKLSEQQIAQLSNLHHQHYYQHLQYMHQLHQMHHLHHLHHLHHQQMHQQRQQQQQQQQQPDRSKSQQSQQQQQQQTSSKVMPTDCSKTAASSPAKRANELSGRSTKTTTTTTTAGSSSSAQFYGSPDEHFEQMYANMSASSNGTNRFNSGEQSATAQNGCRNERLVNNEATNQIYRSSATGINASHNSSSKTVASQQQQPSQRHQYSNLPQIDEINGLPDSSSMRLTGDIVRSSPARSALGNARDHQQTRGASRTPTRAHYRQQSPNPTTSPNGSSASSSSSSPTSSSNLTPSSASSFSSINSLTNTPLSRTALRHTTTDLNRRQFSVERELTGSIPMAATLSRVGSCRSASATGRQATMLSSDELISDDLVTLSLENCAQMRHPPKSQQPPMRTSKILSICNSKLTTNQATGNAKLAATINGKVQSSQATTQSGVVSSSTTTAQARQQVEQQGNLLLGRKQALKQVDEMRQVTQTNGKQTVNGMVDKLTNNLASIKLNDAFAFSSLRAPKKSASGGNLLHTLGVSNSNSNNNNNDTNKSLRRPVDDNLNAITGRKHANSQKLATGATGNTSNNNSGNKSELAKHSNKTDASGKSKSSSVWFEYGCV